MGAIPTLIVHRPVVHRVRSSTIVVSVTSEPNNASLVTTRTCKVGIITTLKLPKLCAAGDDTGILTSTVLRRDGVERSKGRTGA